MTRSCRSRIVRSAVGRALALAAITLAFSAPVHAQQREPGMPPPHRPRQGDGGANRAQLEQQFRERVGAMLTRELELTAEQARELEQVNRRMEAERAPIVRRERALRRELRAELAAVPDERRIDALLTELVAIEARRAALLEREQRALAAFLRPSQRARYLALQENVRRRMLQRPPADAVGPPERRRPPG